MVDYFLLPSTQWDVVRLFETMRPSDVDEVLYSQAANGVDIKDLLLDRVGKDNYFTLWRNDEIVALGGITQTTWTPSIGVIWLLGSDLADKHWRAMTRACRAFILSNKTKWKGIGNHVPSHAAKRQRWLQYLGFDIANKEAQISGYKFKSFYMDLS